MRRFLLWSVLAVIVGFGLAGLGYGAVWYLLAPQTATPVARHQSGPDRTVRTKDVVTVSNAEELQRLLDETSWISAGDGQGDPVWIVGDRQALEQSASRIEGLKPGTALRIVAFAPADEGGVSQASGPDRATVAELWLTRDWLLYERWMATAPDKWTAAGIPPAEQDTARSGLVETGRRFVERLSALTQADGLSRGYPLVIWTDTDGVMKACACATDGAWRAADVVVDTPAAPTVVPPENAPAPAPARSGPAYPTVKAAPVPTPQTTTEARSEPATRRAGRPVDRTATPARPAPVRAPPERNTPPRRPERQTADRQANDRAPRAERQADSMFY